jgi:hypothetical protein
MVDATAGGSDDVIKAREVAHEQRLGSGRLRIEPAVRHRLAATGLIARIVDIVAEPLQKLERGDADVREEGVDIAGNEKTDFHLSLLGLQARISSVRLLSRPCL